MSTQTARPVVRYHVDGMHCASCVGRVEHALESVSGVSEVSVNLATNEARVTTDGTDVDETQLRSAVEAAGYKLLPIERKHGATHDHDAHDHAHDHAAGNQSVRLIVAVVLGIAVMAIQMSDIEIPGRNWILLGLSLM